MEIAPAVPELMAAALNVGMSMAETTMLSKAWEAVSASAQMANKELIFCDHSFQFPVSTGRTRVGAHLRRQPRRRVNCKSIFLSGKIPRRLAELLGAGGARGSIGRAPLRQRHRPAASPHHQRKQPASHSQPSAHHQHTTAHQSARQTSPHTRAIIW